MTVKFSPDGANRKATLRSFGIETAAVYHRGLSLMRITELDTIHKDELLEWRHQMENKFRFDPSRGMDKSDIQPLIHKFQPKLKPLERELHMGPEALYKTQQTVLKTIPVPADDREECKRSCAGSC